MKKSLVTIKTDGNGRTRRENLFAKMRRSRRLKNIRKMCTVLSVIRSGVQRAEREFGGLGIAARANLSVCRDDTSAPETETTVAECAFDAPTSVGHLHVAAKTIVGWHVGVAMFEVVELCSFEFQPVGAELPDRKSVV